MKRMRPTCVVRAQRPIGRITMVEPGSGDDGDDRPAERRDTPGGPYFGRLLIVLFAAVAFCGFMTWLLSTFVTN